MYKRFEGKSTRLARIAGSAMILLLLAILLAVCQPAVAQEQEPLSSRWKKWLNEEVVHIISTREREIFLQLKNDEQRERFVELFWEKRDPTPGTELNEFRVEHERRVAFADRVFGYDSPRRGALSERGRFYIALGPPRSQQSFPSGSSTYPMELWFYEGDITKKLPPFFYLLFYKRFGTGDYILYDPIMDGPEALVATTNPRISAYELLLEVDAELARAAYNYLASEGTPYQGKPSMSSLMLLDRIDRLKDVGVDARYAERLLAGDEEITTDYTFSNIELQRVIFPSLNEIDFNLVDVAIEIPPDKIDLGQYKDKIYGAFEVDVRLADPEGSTVYSATDNVELELNPREFERLKQHPLLYTLRFPSVPGKYNLSINFRNEVTRTVFLVNQTLEIPAGAGERLDAGQILLSSGLEKLGSARIDNVRPMQFADVLLRANPSGVYAPGDTLVLYCQIFAPPGTAGAQQGGVKVAFSIASREGDELASGTQVIPADQFSTNGLFHFFMRWPLKDFRPGRYTVLLQISSQAGGPVLLRNTNFDIVAGEVVSPVALGGKGVDLFSLPVLLDMSGMWRHRGIPEAAEGLLRAAVERNPGNDECGLALAELLMETGKHEDVLGIVEPMLIEKPNEPALLRLAGISYFNVGDYSMAAKLFQRLVAQEGESTFALNMLGSASQRAGDTEAAVAAWRRSLELDPGQEEIKRLLEKPNSEQP